jgi:hypothetical protein
MKKTIKPFKSVLVAVLLVVSFLCHAQNFEYFVSLSHAKSYQYPTLIGSQEWKKFKSLNEKSSACQIPDQVLDTISTEGLIWTCLNYPMFSNIFAFNDLQTGFNSVNSYFNGIEELYSRDNSIKELLSLFYRINPDEFKNEWTPEDKGGFALLLIWFELLISEHVMIANLSNNDADKAIQDCMQKLSIKSVYPVLFSEMSNISLLMIISKIMYYSNYEPFINEVKKNILLYSFIIEGKNYNISIKETIIRHANNYINNN